MIIIFRRLNNILILLQIWKIKNSVVKKQQESLLGFLLALCFATVLLPSLPPSSLPPGPPSLFPLWPVSASGPFPEFPSTVTFSFPPSQCLTLDIIYIYIYIYIIPVSGYMYIYIYYTSLGGDGFTVGHFFHFLFLTIQGKTMAKHARARQSLQSRPCARPAHVAEFEPGARLQVLKNSRSWMCMLRVKTLLAWDRHWRNPRRKKL